MRAARFRGEINHKQLLRRWEASVTTEIWRRAARMVKACFPKLSRHGQVLADVHDEDVSWDLDEDVGAEGS